MLTTNDITSPIDDIDYVTGIGTAHVSNIYVWAICVAVVMQEKT